MLKGCVGLVLKYFHYVFAWRGSAAAVQKAFENSNSKLRTKTNSEQRKIMNSQINIIKSYSTSAAKK